MRFQDLPHKIKTLAILGCFRSVRLVLKDKLTRSSVLFLGVSISLFGLSYSIYAYQTDCLKTLILDLSHHTANLEKRRSTFALKQTLPAFETVLQSRGAYHPLLRLDDCIKTISSKLIQKIKPTIKGTFLPRSTTFGHMGTYTLSLKASFDYELFDIIQFILGNPDKFGYTRVREFELQQVFETSPIVKGTFTYDQLSIPQ